jgi:glycosyltransferase involved in cell wall biosynthesis
MTPGVGFVVFGDGRQRPRLKQRIATANLAGRFVLAGHCTSLDALLPALDLVVLPSYTEGLPNIVLEAFAASVPVIATAVGGTPELVDDGVNGLLISPGSAAAMATACAQLLAAPQRRAAMGRAGRIKVEDHFTFKTQARAYERLFARWKTRPLQARRQLEAVA